MCTCELGVLCGHHRWLADRGAPRMMLGVTPAEIDAPSDREPDWALEIPDDDASHAAEQFRHAVTLHDMCGPDEEWA